VEITITNQTPLARTSAPTASGFGMPMGGQSCFGILTERRATWIPATGMSSSIEAMTDVTDLRDRKDLAAKGHVAFVAYVPGYPAWSPPIC